MGGGVWVIFTSGMQQLKWSRAKAFQVMVSQPGSGCDQPGLRSRAAMQPCSRASWEVWVAVVGSGWWWSSSGCESPGPPPSAVSHVVHF